MGNPQSFNGNRGEGDVFLIWPFDFLIQTLVKQRL